MSENESNFQNVPPIDFSLAESRASFQAAIDKTGKRIRGNEFGACPIVGGEFLSGGNTLPSVDPADPERIIGTVRLADKNDTLRALKTLKGSSKSWAQQSPEKRHDIIKKAGDIMLERREELAALIVYEVGKPWKEADADVIEAIDFCHYYAQEMLKHCTGRILLEVPGEKNIYLHSARGIGVIIAPWNFPLAIACGMTVASLVCGNATVLKPAEQSSIIAFEFFKILLEAGVPENACALLPGIGEEIGPILTDHPDVDLICFTGSKAVGLDILSRTATVQPGQQNIKKVISEMGGKNAIVIDEDADLDEAIKGVLYSAFGFAGQKCSACSRVICVGDSYEPFLERIREATGDILIGHPADSSTFLGPVIDATSRDRLLTFISTASQTQTLHFKGNVPEKGYYVPATLFRDVDTQSPLWKQELFGPVLACRKEDSFEAAVSVAMDSEYALTGGVFSRSPQNIEHAYLNYQVGNLYINRSITGAIVLRQPFGGSRMSGVGAKAGGPDYLLQFLQPRTITENTMRRGFTPELL